MDDEDLELLRDVHRDVEDSAAEIGNAVERLEAGETTASEALLGEAFTRLKLLGQRLHQRLDVS